MGYQKMGSRIELVILKTEIWKIPTEAKQVWFVPSFCPGHTLLVALPLLCADVVKAMKGLTCTYGNYIKEKS